MQGIYFDISHVPFTASQSEYPGLKIYVTEMKKYEPNYVDDEVAIQGWESAALFVQGVKMAGNNLTQANVIKEDNSITSFTAGGLHVADQLEERRPQRPAPPYCLAYIKVVGNQVRADTEQGKERVQLLRVDQPEEGPGLPAAGRHAGARPDRGGRVGRASGTGSGARWSSFSDSRSRAFRTGARTRSSRSASVLTYQATGVFNFAFGAQAFASAFVFTYLTAVPRLVGVRGLPGLGRGDGTRDGLGLRPVVVPAHRELQHGRPRWCAAWRSWSGSQALCPVIFGPQNLDATATILPFFNPNTVYFTSVGTPINGIYLSTISVTAVVLILLTILLRYTNLGLQMRAAVESRRLVQLDGVNANGVVAVAWIVSSFMASLAGVLLAPVFGRVQF